MTARIQPATDVMPVPGGFVVSIGGESLLVTEEELRTLVRLAELELRGESFEVTP